MRPALVCICLLLAAVACATDEVEDFDTTMCDQAPDEFLETVEEGLVGQASIDEGHAFHSGTADTWFVAIEMDRAGIKDIGVWATPNDPEEAQDIRALNEVAAHYSKFDDARETDPQLTMDTHGAQEAKLCVEERA